jgi:hypothetical protein
MSDSIGEMGVIDVQFVSGAQVFMDEDGETVISVAWVECPVLKKKHITLRAAASRETAERYCRDMMQLLGITEATL